MALRVLERVEADGAFAAAALSAELQRSELDARDRAFASELVYGVLRTRGSLLARLRAHVPKKFPQKDTRLVASLLLAAYQLLFLDRVPAHAAVNAAAEQVRRERGARVAGFANAVLRKLAADRGCCTLAEAIDESLPVWLREALHEAIGVDEARALMGLDPQVAERFVPARIAIRLFDEPSPELLASTEPARHVREARYVSRGHPAALPGHAAGGFLVHEEGSQLIALALGKDAGSSVLDACAGRGQKTAVLRQHLGPQARIWATDVHEQKLRQLEQQFDSLGLEPAHTLACDWSVAGAGLPEGTEVDAALIDAPCTGVGTLRRRPEIASRLAPGDPVRLAALSTAIARNVARAVRPGGRIVFAVCSVLPAECEAVVQALGDLAAPTPFAPSELSTLAGQGATSVRLLPGQHGTDGYFIASLRRT